MSEKCLKVELREQIDRKGGAGRFFEEENFALSYTRAARIYQQTKSRNQAAYTFVVAKNVQFLRNEAS